MFKDVLKKITGTKIGECSNCGKAMYQGELHGYETEANPLSITGFYTHYFCRNCIEKQTGSFITESTIGEKYIISRRNGERSRITITK